MTHALTFKNYVDGDQIESVDISVDELPNVNDLEEFLTICENHQIPSMVLHDIALEYYRINQMDCFQVVLDLLNLN